ncbi:hypothetical protein [Kitasatospora sp. NPDC004531]
MPSTPTPASTDAFTVADRPVPAAAPASGPASGVRRRLTVTVHVDPAGRVLLYRRTPAALAHPGHYDLFARRMPAEGHPAGGFLVVRRLLTDRPPAPWPGEADWCGFVRPAELLAGRYRPLVPGRLDVLRRLLAAD